MLHPRFTIFCRVLCIPASPQTADVIALRIAAVAVNGSGRMPAATAAAPGFLLIVGGCLTSSVWDLSLA